MMFYRPLSKTVVLGSQSGAEEARYAKSQVELLKLDIERLLMITEALWGILKEKHGLDEDYLDRLVAEIDMRDGTLDGRVAPTEAGECPECGAKLQKRRPTCLFCGTPILKDAFER